MQNHYKLLKIEAESLGYADHLKIETTGVHKNEIGRLCLAFRLAAWSET